MARMYHPKTGAEIEVADSDEVVAVHEESGWKIAPEPKATEPGVVPEPVTYAPVGGVDSYSNWTKDELVAELEKRDLPKSGTKDELVDRLVESDLER